MAQNSAKEDRKPAPKRYSAEDARQGEIILRRPWQRWVFAAGFIGIVVLALFATVWMVG